MVHHFHREVEALKKKILSLSAIVEEDVQHAVKSVVERDASIAQRVIDDDYEIDHNEVEVEEDCLKILALHQPVAIDLRFIIAVLKINNDLERIGDLAVNIAERALAMASQPRLDSGIDFGPMAAKVQSMLRRSLDSLVNMDCDLAREVIRKDDEVDALNREIFMRVHEGIRKNPDRVEMMISLLSVSRNLERIADYATNIAEDVIYMSEGEIVRHKAETLTDEPKRASG
jgi:phosphate transport system protein